MQEYASVVANIEKPIFGKITRNKIALSRKHSILVSNKTSFLPKGFTAIITRDKIEKSILLPQAIVSEDVQDKLIDGDYVRIATDGTISILWERKSLINSLLLTEACDCRCLMCPQPPKKHDKNLIEINKQILNHVKIDNDQTICLTGGEPTLVKDEFFEILRLIKKKYPKSTVMMLTNGKSFDNFDFTKDFVLSRPKDFITCVSIHCDVDEIHDQIAGAQNSFYKTIMGLQNLARFREKIEIRIVVNRLNAHRLESIATFIQRNFPFVFHCAFMGMEIFGLARDNYDAIWIDPYDYREELSRAVRVLNRADMNVSVYNMPLCLIERDIWSYARLSISEWKNDYLPVCDTCSVKSQCCGIFTTSGDYQSAHINAL
jgi:His-Xaa-Ser system radical SAM maturase HxsC